MENVTESTHYIAIKPDCTIQGEFYRHLCDNGYDMYVDGAKNVMLISEDHIYEALTCLDDRGVRYEIL